MHTISAGPQAVIDTFATIPEIWADEAFGIQALFDSGENFAIFGRITCRSRSLDQANTSPFLIWFKVNWEGKITNMQSMEDTLGTTDTSKKNGKKRYVVFEEQVEVEVWRPSAPYSCPLMDSNFPLELMFTNI